VRFANTEGKQFLKKSNADRRNQKRFDSADWSLHQ